MNIEEFFNRFVDGYLLSDLETMEYVSARPNGYGHCGYSMIMTCLAGVELLGGITSAAPFTTSARANRSFFGFFWSTYLYPVPPRANLVDAVYPLIRNGIAHTFTAKPGVTVHKSRHPQHLQRVRGDFIIDALSLSDDFRTAYLKVRGELAEPTIRANMQSQLNRMIAAYSGHSETAAVILDRLATEEVVTPSYSFIPSGAVSYSPPAPSGSVDVSSPTVVRLRHKD